MYVPANVYEVDNTVVQVDAVSDRIDTASHVGRQFASRTLAFVVIFIPVITILFLVN